VSTWHRNDTLFCSKFSSLFFLEILISLAITLGVTSPTCMRIKMNSCQNIISYTRTHARTHAHARFHYAYNVFFDALTFLFLTPAIAHIRDLNSSASWAPHKLYGKRKLHEKKLHDLNIHICCSSSIFRISFKHHKAIIS